MKIAVLITSYNRKEKTLACLQALKDQQGISTIEYDIYLVDDNSSDGTGIAIKESYPNVNVINGTGNLYWAGGMRLAMEAARKSARNNYNYYLLLNDDTVLFNNAVSILIEDLKILNINDVVLVGSTKGNPALIDELTYGGRLLLNKYNSASKIVIPNGTNCQKCELGNANIMLISKSVVDKIGFFSSIYTHGIADFDYTLRAKKTGIPTYISSKYLGECQIDNNAGWLSFGKSTLRERIDFLYSVKGLAYREYLYYIKKHFPYYVPHAWLLLWAKTFLPVLWDLFKKEKFIR